MTRPGPPTGCDFGDYSPETLAELAARCGDFERNWSPGLMIESFLDGAADGLRPGLLLSLLTIDLEKRLAAGEPLPGDSYLRRFPSDRELIEAAFRQLGLDPPADAEAPGTADTVAFQKGDTVNRPVRLPSIENYHLLELIDRGGMGVVYKAQQRHPPRLVALKMIAHLSAQGAGAIQRFRNEVESAAVLDHPGIVPIYDVGEHEGAPYYTMKYIPGSSLAERCRKPLSEAEAVRLAVAVTEALQHAHQKGVVHRDIKLSNVLLDEDGRPYVADFGIAKRLGAGPGLTASGQILGTPSYMSPEQALGREVDERTDIYSLGALLYAMLTGRPPFEAHETSVTLKQVIEDPPLSPRQLNPTISLDLETICLKCLEKSPDSRFATAEELAADLRRVQRREPIRSRPVSVPVRVVRWCRRKPKDALLVAIGVVAMGAILFQAISQSYAARREQALRKESERSLQFSRVREMQLKNELATRLSPGLQTSPLRPGTGLDGSAMSALGTIPRELRSIDYYWLLERTRSDVTPTAHLADADWAILDVLTFRQGKRAISVDAGGLMSLWNLETGALLRHLVEGRRTAEPLLWRHHYRGRPEGSTPRDWGPCYVALERDGEDHFVAASVDGALTRFALPDDQPADDEPAAETLFRAESPLVCVATGNGAALAGSQDGRLYLRTAEGPMRSVGQRGHGGVQAAAWSESSDAWIVGYEDGQVQALDGQTLETRGEHSQAGPIWSLSASQWGDTPIVAVGGAGPEVRLLRLAENGFEQAGILAFDTGSTATEVHHVQFSQAGRQLYAADNLGGCTKWHAVDGVALWNAQVCSKDHRMPSVQKELGDALPLAFQRIVAVVEELEGGRLLTAGADTMLKIWDSTGPTNSDGIAPLPPVGPSPRIRFDRERPETLWAQDTEGTLWTIDTKTNQALDKHPAHAGGAADLSAPVGKEIASVGGDRQLRFWRLNRRGKIVESRPPIEHDENLLSVDWHAATGLIAVVDAVGRLAVWNVETRQQVFLTSLQSGDSAARPLTGRLAFNPTGQYLCAFGPGQSAHLFTTRPFRRIDDQPWVAGNGGAALVWNPRHPAVVMVGDDVGRYATTSVDRKAVELEGRQIRQDDSGCVALISTPDQRRIISLQENGRLAFLEASEQLQVLTLRMPPGFDRDLAVDRDNRRLVVAGDEGQLMMLIVDGPPPELLSDARAEDQRKRWKKSTLAEPAGDALRANPRAFQWDSQGRLHGLIVRSKPQDFRDEGALHYLRFDGQQALEERIEVDGAIHDRRITIQSTDLEIGPDQSPVVVFRRRTAHNGTYDGEVHAATRQDGAWRTELLLPHGNDGFYPVLTLTPAGEPQQLFHFSFHGFRLLRSGPSAAGPWTSTALGRSGDGLRMEGLAAGNSVYLVYQRNVFNSMPSNRAVARWDGAALRRENWNPFALEVGALSVDAGGRLVALEYDARRARLVRQTDGGWETLCELPDPSLRDFALLPNDDIYAGPLWDAASLRLQVWRRRGGKWSLFSIADLPQRPNLLELTVDPNGQPAVLAGGHLHAPGSWLNLYRPK